MKYTGLALSALALSATTTLAAPVENQKRGVVALSVAHRHIGRSQWAKRDYVKEPLQNQIYQYVANISVGTPAQEIQVLLDTGSSDLWVYTDKAVGDNGGYASGKSSSYQFKSDGFEIQYVSGSAKGDWVTDIVALEKAEVKNQQFATVDTVTTPGDNPIGIFGIGFTAGESHGGQEYSNFPQSLVDQDLIGRNAYSLYLDNVNAATGQVLFGGVDTKKFKDQLTVVPIVSDTSLTVNFEAEGVKDSVVLDCGTSLSYLPQSIISSIVKRFGATFDPNTMLYYVDEVGDKSVDIKFGDATINVPASEMVLEAAAFDVPNPPKKYILSFIENNQSNGINLLGDSFLRSAYVVFDLENKNVAIGQASYSSESDIQSLEKGTDIPGAKQQSAPQSNAHNDGSGNQGNDKDITSTLEDLFGIIKS